MSTTPAVSVSECREHADPPTREALRHSSALLEGFRALKQGPLNTRTAEQVCTRIKGMEMQVRRVPGTALANQATGEVIYTPPVGEDVLRPMLANWERYLHEARDVDPLVRMAVGHYQFEAIHPFTDGNGRYETVPPTTNAGRACVTQCAAIRETCRGNEIRRARLASDACHQRNEQAYRSCLATADTPEKKQRCERNRSSCWASENHGRCDDDYRSCFGNCGGTVKKIVENW